MARSRKAASGSTSSSRGRTGTHSAHALASPRLQRYRPPPHWFAMSDAARIVELTKELNGILETRLVDLAAAMRGAEGITRQIVSSEMEIARYKQLQDSLSSEGSDLKRETAALRARADELRSSHGGLIGERDKLRAEVARFEQAARDDGGETERLRARAFALEAEADKGKGESEALQTRVKALEDNVAKVQKLKDELKRQIAALNLGTKE